VLAEQPSLGRLSLSWHQRRWMRWRFTAQPSHRTILQVFEHSGLGPGHVWQPFRHPALDEHGHRPPSPCRRCVARRPAGLARASIRGPARTAMRGAAARQIHDAGRASRSHRPRSALRGRPRRRQRPRAGGLGTDRPVRRSAAAQSGPESTISNQPSRRRRAMALPTSSSRRA